MNEALDKENFWTGGYYEAAILLGKTADEGADERLLSSLSTIWENSALALYSDKLLTNDCSLSLLGPEPLGFGFSLYGTLSHKIFGVFPFVTHSVREQEYSDGEDWLDLCIPLGGLSQVCNAVGGWPFGNEAKSVQWRKPLEKTLSEMVLNLADTVPFTAACIGFEISGQFDESLLHKNIPLKRRIGYVVPQSGTYTYFPTNDWSESGVTIDVN